MRHIWTLVAATFMEEILRTILKTQNLEVLKRIAHDHHKPLQELKEKYWTPSFYSPSLNTDHVYEIEERIATKQRVTVRKGPPVTQK